MLIVDDKWLLLGPNRHGNTFAKLVVEAGFPGRTEMVSDSKHWPLCKIAPEYREGKIIIGITRDPLFWYHSKWKRFWNDSPNKRYGFEEYFHRHWNKPHGPIGKNMEDLPLSPAGIGAWSYKNIAYNCLDAPHALAEIRTQEELSAAYPSLLSVDDMIFTETLPADLVRVFGAPVRQHVGMPIPNRSSEPEDILPAYTPEMLELLRQGDGWLVTYYPNLHHAALFA